MTPHFVPTGHAQAAWQQGQGGGKRRHQHTLQDTCGFYYNSLQRDHQGGTGLGQGTLNGHGALEPTGSSPSLGSVTQVRSCLCSEISFTHLSPRGGCAVFLTMLQTAVIIT